MSDLENWWKGFIYFHTELQQFQDFFRDQTYSYYNENLSHI